jgi:hypothetical protein
MQKTRYRDSRYLQLLRYSKGKICFVIDSLDNYHRWFFQKIYARKIISTDETKYLHILCIKRDDYVLPAINCVNSFWQYHPEYRVKIWCDSLRLEKLQQKLRRFHRVDRLEFSVIELKESWQENKLNVICNELYEQHIFSDADIFWNGRVSVSDVPLFFLREYDFEEYSATKRLKELLKLDDSKTWYMLNVSVVNLGLLSRNVDLSNRAKHLFDFIIKLEEDSVLGKREILQLRRTSEQLAISIAVQEIGNFDFIKTSDYILDGGIVESFYLGATKGF